MAEQLQIITSELEGEIRTPLDKIPKIESTTSQLEGVVTSSIISPDKIISDFLPKIKTTTSKVYDYSLGTSKEIPLKHLCLPIWFRLEENISDTVIEEIKESLGV